MNAGSLQILEGYRYWEGYRVKEDILRNGREQKGEGERSPVLLTFKMEILQRFSTKVKVLKLLRKRERQGKIEP